MLVQIDINEIKNAIIDMYGNYDIMAFNNAVGEIVVSDIKRNVFDKLGYPSNTILAWNNKQVSWPLLALATMTQRVHGSRKKGSKQWNEKPSWPPPKGLLLQRTGQLRESIFYSLTSTGVVISAGVFYARFLQLRFPFLILTMSAMEEIAEQAGVFFAIKNALK
jgi:hypothetical protein